MGTQIDTEVQRVRADVPNRLDDSDRSRYLFAGIAVACIWIAVAIASILSPDMVTGSQHEHLPIAAFGDWLYAAIRRVWC